MFHYTSYHKYLTEKTVKFVGGASFQGNITLGDHVVIGTNSNFMSTGAKIEIGNSVLFGPHIFIITGNHQINQIGKCIIDVEKKTECCDADVWIGAGTIVLKGVRIGRGSVIGAGSIVTKDTQPYSINAGNPCRKIRMRFTDSEIKEHEKRLRP